MNIYQAINSLHELGFISESSYPELHTFDQRAAATKMIRARLKNAEDIWEYETKSGVYALIHSDFAFDGDYEALDQLIESKKQEQVVINRYLK